jgi:hypothetical protein
VRVLTLAARTRDRRDFVVCGRSRPGGGSRPKDAVGIQIVPRPIRGGAGDISARGPRPLTDFSRLIFWNFGIFKFRFSVFGDFEFSRFRFFRFLIAEFLRLVDGSIRSIGNAMEPLD